MGNLSNLVADLSPEQRELFLLRMNKLEEREQSILRTLMYPTSKESSPLVLLQEGEPKKQPLFFVHTMDGTAFCYVELIRHLGLDRPCYGLQTQGINARQSACARVEMMASQYIRLVQTVQPEGPYLLGGWCVGGVVAFEMAKQLQAQDQVVGLLAIIDANAPVGKQNPQLDDEATILASWALREGSPVCQTFDRERFGQIAPEDRLAYVLDEAKRAGAIPLEVGLTQARHLLDVSKSNIQALARYVPCAYSGTITFFKASQGFKEEELVRWGKLADGGLMVHEVPGDHYTMLREPNVAILAEHLKRHLRTID